MNKTFKILSVNISKEKGEKKRPVSQIVLQKNFGIMGDAHADGGHRQISLLAQEDITQGTAGVLNISFGAFGENVTTEGINLSALPLGTKLQIGTVILQITQVGKQCHGEGCSIFKQSGKCIMPSKGVFAQVIQGGIIHAQDIGTHCF